ncbi:hypothetical protein SEVIR_9G164300v4 [Setaria viridis]|uniref:TF-B3 domain-containing protein n=1 Tax=Setaria viridis TaxID=4556 RepID=A0A4U6SUT7_SETVI|nr:putative B3 domain-containing protein Os03g0621600 isoform X2 [Setaria viridis]TKV92470.1 hypothetical protein SEVIR_9G164300v2 [Setaria viridis]
MRKPGKKCKERDAYHHWYHSDEQERYFFKVMTDDFSERLGIPDKFVQHFRGRIAKTVKLESRTGCTFNVEVTKSLGKVVLQTGWKAFVCAHDLKMGDFLVFRYDGTSRLKVWIFDLSCCEKMPPCHFMRSPIRGGGKGEEQIEISRSCDDLPMESTEIKSKAWKQREGSMNLNTSSTSSSDSSGDSLSPEDQKSHSVPSYILPQRTYLTCVQKKKLKERVRAICSKTPIYGCVMKKSSIDAKPQTMDISREYADVYLPFEDQTLLLQHRGKSWEVGCRINIHKSNSGTKRLSKGWKQFARDNNLQLGDLCLFELLENKKYTMNVHIIRIK